MRETYTTVFMGQDANFFFCKFAVSLYQSLRHPSDATSLYTKEAMVAVNLYVFDFRFSFCILHFQFTRPCKAPNPLSLNFSHFPFSFSL